MAANGEDPMVQNRSKLKDFIGTVATMSGDLSNVTAPPFLLDSKSTVEIPSYWAENPAIFCSPASSDDPVERALLILRSFLSGIKSQCYMGKAVGEPLKKPLNAFLGELFLARWEDKHGTTQMVGEQVSHHPPVTACRIWNEKYGIVTESFNRSSISMSMSVQVESTGIVLKTIEKYNEQYLLPIPNFSVKSLLTTPSPSLTGTYYIPSSSGYMSVVHFSEKSMFGSSSKTHSFVAHVYKESDGENNPIYTIEGHWDGQFVVRDNIKKQDVEKFDVQSQAIDTPPPMTIDSVDEQDPWESRNAWKDVIASLDRGDMQGTSDGKNRLEEGQRQMRTDEESAGKSWEPLFFKPTKQNAVLENLVAKIPSNDSRGTILQGETVWTMDLQKWKNSSKPYHGSLHPDNSRHGQESSQNQRSQEQSKSNGVDHSFGAVKDGRPADVDGLKPAVEQQPRMEHLEANARNESEPQVAQTGTKEEYQGSGVEAMSLDDKNQIENMLREQYASGPPTAK